MLETYCYINMKKISILLIFIGLSYSQRDSVSIDSLLDEKFDLLLNSEIKKPNEFNLSFKDSMTAVWKKTFRSRTSELDILSDHLKNPRYERNFIGIELISLFSSLAELIGIKENSTDENGNKLDVFERELYNENAWKRKQLLLISDSVRVEY